MKKLSKKTLNKAFRNWYYGHLTCFSQEHMQTFGYLCAMLPVIEELYDTKEEQKEALETYKAFFNTEPQLGTIIVGVTVGLEEARANQEGVDSDTINGLRAGLMGPIAGIGDSLVVGVLIPLLLGIALGLSTGGSPVGAVVYIIAWNVIITLGMRLLFFKGYELGGKAVEFLTGEKSQALRESIMMLGSMVIGAVAATWVSVKTVFEMSNPDTGEVFLNLNDQINSVLPQGLTAIFVLLCWFLIAKKKMSPLKVMLLLVVIAFVGVLIGFFDPQLTY